MVADRSEPVSATLLDPHFAAHLMVTARPFIRFYAAARLVVRGVTVGTLYAHPAAALG